VKIFRLRPSKFKKFSPAALKKKEIWLLEVKIQKIFACGAKNGRNLAS